MLGAVNRTSWELLLKIEGEDVYTDDVNELDELSNLYDAGWVNMEEDERWYLTLQGFDGCNFLKLMFR